METMGEPGIAIPETGTGPGVPDVPVLRVAGLAKSFGATKALRDCSLELRGGEVHAVMGENGSGKSTLVKILTGVHRPDAGTLELGGRPVAPPRSPASAIASGVVAVFQEVLTVPARSVLDNVWLGADGIFRTRVPREVKRERATEVLTEILGVCPDLDAPIESLSLSDRQACGVARALLRRPRVLILDEATSALDVATRDRLFGAIGRLRADGVAVMFISHRMDEVEHLVDRVTVLRSGESVATLERDEMSVAELVRLMTGGEHLVEESAGAPERAEPGEVVLEVPGLRLRAGEIVGLAGLEGHGQDEFLRSLRDAGEGVAYVPRDRRGESIFAPLSIRENFAAATQGVDARGGVLSPRRAKERFAEYAERLAIRLGRDTDAITTLSGGNQQKVIIARWLAAHPKVLLLNDPTRGVDLGAKRDIYALLRELTRSGVAIVMLSTEVDEHVELMDRVLVFRSGSVAVELSREELSRGSIVGAFFSSSSDDRAATSEDVRERGSGLARLPSLLREHTYLVAAAVAVALIIANTIALPNFANPSYWPQTLAGLAPLAIAAMAVTPSIISGGGGIDISVAPLLTLVNVVIVVGFFSKGTTSPLIVIPIALALGLGVGAVNGFMVAVLRFQPVVATLCANFILTGLGENLAPQTVSASSTWTSHLGGKIGPIPGALVTLAVPLLIWYGLRRTAFIRTLYAVGGDDATAFTAGVNVTAVRVLAYTLGGLFAAISGIAMVALISSADTSIATQYTLLAIASVALGGTALAGGRGGLIGSLIGAACISFIEDLISSLHMSEYWMQAVYGGALIAAVLLGARLTAQGRKGA